MVFRGLEKVFSTKNEQQYEAIGAFWDYMAERYGRENLRGLGYDWTEDSITYVIGLRQGSMTAEICFPGTVCREIQLPDAGWIRFTGRTENLAQLYDEIYADGILQYEIEQFSDDGSCEVWVIRA